LKNWKTTLVGVGGAAVGALYQWMVSGDLDLQKLWPLILAAAVGALAKDFNGE